MRIEWEHESFESGLELWTTEFRGMTVELRKDPTSESELVHVAISAGKDSSLTVWMDPDSSTAMTNALKWINNYWDLLEEGPVDYESIELPPEAQA